MRHEVREQSCDIDLLRVFCRCTAAVSTACDALLKAVGIFGTELEALSSAVEARCHDLDSDWWVGLVLFFQCNCCGGNLTVREYSRTVFECKVDHVVFRRRHPADSAETRTAVAVRTDLSIVSISDGRARIFWSGWQISQCSLALHQWHCRGPPKMLASFCSLKQTTPTTSVQMQRIFVLSSYGVSQTACSRFHHHRMAIERREASARPLWIHSQLETKGLVLKMSVSKRGTHNQQAQSNMGESDHGEWEEWEGDDAAPTLLHSSEAPSMEAPGKGDVEKPKSDPLSWTWDLSAMEEDLVSLTPVREGSALISSEATPDEEKLGSLVSAGPWVMQRVNETRSQVESTRALALVTKWHVLRMRQSLSPGNDDKTLGAIDVELSAISGEWGTDTNDFEAEHEQLREVTTLLHHSLAACEDAMEPFQQAFEQLFASFPEQSLCISSTWIRPTNGQSDTLTSSTSASFDAYLRRVVALCDTDLHSLFRVSQLTEAEAFQDAKDIQRDELVVNSEEVVGAIGYDEIVNRIQAHIRSQISSHLGSIDEDNYDKTRVVAQQILNACNRTESGGTSYETLSQFVSNHTMDHVLIRPASEKAPPLRIDMDVGPFRDEAHGDGWCFGLRVKVSAITWYWICDAADPTIEYYQIQTTYANRLAFGLGLTAFSSSSLMRRDVATVMITLMNTSSDELMGTQLLYEAEEAADAAEDGEVDFDALM